MSGRNHSHLRFDFRIIFVLGLIEKHAIGRIKKLTEDLQQTKEDFETERKSLKELQVGNHMLCLMKQTLFFTCEF